MIHLPIPSIFSMHEHPIIHGITILILTIPFLIYGFDIIKSGLLKLIHRSPNMDSLVTVGVLTSFIYSLVNLIIMLITKKDVYLYFESVAMIIYFMKLGRFLDKRSKDKTKEAIEEKMQNNKKRNSSIKDGEDIPGEISRVKSNKRKSNHKSRRYEL